MKIEGFGFCICASVAAHAAVVCIAVGMLRGTQIPAGAEGGEPEVVTLVSAPEGSIRDAETAMVTPLSLRKQQPAEVLPAQQAVTAPAETVTVTQPAQPLAPEISPVRAELEGTVAVPVAATNPAAPVESVMPRPVAGNDALPSVTSEKAARATGDSANGGEDRTSMQAAVGPRARPAYRRNPEPAYPAAARRRHEEGTVLLTVRVAANGTTSEVIVKRSSGFRILDEAAIRAVRDWEFEPARVNSRSIESEVDVPVRFTLRE